MYRIKKLKEYNQIKFTFLKLFIEFADCDCQDRVTYF